jgi:hypothetical protein
MDVLALIAALLFVLLTAFNVAGFLRLRSGLDVLLAMYLIAFAEIVLVMLLLSPVHWLTAGHLGIVILVVAGVAAICTRVVPGWSPPPLPLVSAREALRDRVNLVLAIAVLGGLCYVAALIVGTAPNDYDVLWYHLARAAFWKQQHAVGYIPNVNDARLNGFPPNAEIAESFTMILSKSDRFVGFVQLTSLLAGMTAIAGIARRIGLSVRQALFGALLFATLPVVILQSAAALNDLVFGSFLVVSAYFLLTWTRVTLALATLALGLAIGTKVTALLGLPMLALFAFVYYPRKRWPGLVLVGVAGTVLGSYWYLFNLAKTKHLGGQLGQPAHSTTVEHGNTYSVAGVIAHFVRLMIDAVDPSGAVGRDRFLYLIGAGVVLALGIRGRKRFGWISIALAVALAALPVAFRAIDHELLHGYQKALISLDRRNLAFLGFDKHLTEASPFQSWYGPAGIMLVIGGFLLVWRARQRGEVPRVAWVLAAAPVVWLALQALTTFYSLFDGRYVVFGVALAAVVWGLLLPIRPLAWTACAVGITAMALALVHYDEKPSGVNILGGAAPTSVWDQSRAQVMSRFLHRGESTIVATLDREAKKGQIVALAIRRNDVSYPFFGPNLDRRVVFLPTSPYRYDWIVVAPGLSIIPYPGTPPPPGSRLVVNENGWRLYRLAS